MTPAARAWRRVYRLYAHDATCLVCGHGTPSSGGLCTTCRDSGETFDERPATPMELAWARRVLAPDHVSAPSDAIAALGPAPGERP